uniref:FUN14 domain containing 1 n=1 Tax=Fundulus heteroclitus TaxID=8078 RepID=A0A3Q2QYH0_FUNHE
MNFPPVHTAGQEEPDSEDEVYEVVDLTEYARRHQWWSRVFGNSSGPIAEKYSVATQIVMGGVTGWCAGYVFQRVGKIAATAIGGGFLLLQATDFIKRNIVLSSGFVGGFFLGMAS